MNPNQSNSISLRKKSFAQFPQYNCDNFSIILPLRFYVKSIYLILKPQNAAILTILAAKNFWVFGNFSSRNSQKSKFNTSKIVKKVDFDHCIIFVFKGHLKTKIFVFLPMFELPREVHKSQHPLSIIASLRHFSAQYLLLGTLTFLSNSNSVWPTTINLKKWIEL